MIATIFFVAVVIIAFTTGEWMGVILLGLAELVRLGGKSGKNFMELTEFQYEYGSICDLLSMVLAIGALLASIWACF